MNSHEIDQRYVKCAQINPSGLYLFTWKLSKYKLELRVSIDMSVKFFLHYHG